MAGDAHHYLDRFRLDGRTALITGASRNIGAAISRAFASAGANLIINARQPEPLARLADELRSEYAIEAIPIAADLGQPSERARLIDEAQRRAAAIDILVNNATASGRGGGLETSAEQWAAAVEMNVLAPAELCRAFVPAMRARGRGTVINVLTSAAFTVIPPMVAYAATKSALWTMTRYLARECAPEVRVNAISPGTVQEGGGLKVPSWAKLVPLTALGRVGEPDELACAALFLASDASSYTTGEVIFVDGGRVMTG